MSALAYEQSPEIAAVDAELTELASRLKTCGNIPERAELLWERIDRLLDRRITLVQEDLEQAWWPDG
jgi:hypothetical protein